jgi:hypothetical protein
MDAGLLRSAWPTRHVAIVDVLGLSGLRVNELIGRTAADVDRRCCATSRATTSPCAAGLL